MHRSLAALSRPSHSSSALSDAASQTRPLGSQEDTSAEAAARSPYKLWVSPTPGAVNTPKGPANSFSFMVIWYTLVKSFTIIRSLW